MSEKIRRVLACPRGCSGQGLMVTKNQVEPAKLGLKMATKMVCACVHSVINFWEGRHRNLTQTFSLKCAYYMVIKTAIALDLLTKC